MRQRAFAATGIAAPVVYVLAVVLGGAMAPGYEHVSRFVSDLIGSGAPNTRLLIPLFGLYNLLVLAFGLWLNLARLPAGNPRGRVGSAGAIVLFVQGIFGMLTLFFPEDPVGAQMSTIGILHIVLAGSSSITTMGSMLLLGLWFRGADASRGLGVYSLVSVGFVFVTGGLLVVLGIHNPVAGLVERLTIGGFLQWLFVTALMLSHPGKEGTNA